jgi:hypothetical protein
LREVMRISRGRSVMRQECPRFPHPSHPQRLIPTAPACRLLPRPTRPHSRKDPPGAGRPTTRNSRWGAPLVAPHRLPAVSGARGWSTGARRAVLVVGYRENARAIHAEPHQHATRIQC